MGKSNRIKTKKASDAVAFGIKPAKKKKGMPNWAVNLITITVAVVILAAVALSLMSANGVFSRWQTAAKSENFRVNGNMMKYYFQTTYSQFLQENGSYVSYMGLDSNLPLKSQPLDTSDPTQGTWHDYMVTMTKSEVTRMLVYCEEAETRGIKLDDEDKKNMKEELKMLETYAEMYGYTNVNNYISVVYGEGMKMKDIRKAMELSMLASKCANTISEELDAKITDERVNAEYDANKLDYDVADYMYYKFSVTYSDAKNALEEGATDEQILAKYKEMINEAKTKASVLAGLTDPTAFKTFILNDIKGDVYDTSYGDIDDESDLAADKFPSEANRETIKEKLGEYVVDMMINDKTYEKVSTEANGVYKIFGIEVTKEFVDFFEGTEEATGVVPTYISNMDYELTNYIKEKASYDESNDDIKWIFGEGRKTGDINTKAEGDSANGAELPANKDELSKYEESVYLVTKAQYRNDAITKNIGVLAYSSAEEAEAALTSLKAGMSLDEFKALAGDTATFTNFEDYAKGDSGVTEFDNWAFGDGITVGAVTSKVIYLAEGTYGIALYYGDGRAEWYVDVRAGILSDDIENVGEEITAKYTVSFNDKAFAKIDV
ncbi:MAG: hypothetical protein E7653_06195 [Ruminococcaceae bacterium]|nr:hypothetical protein [Oscillospiraceae bacterium]